MLIGCLRAACEAAVYTAAACGVSPPEQLSAPRILYIGFRKAKLKKSYREHGTVQV
jgi:hypothetical protein